MKINPYLRTISIILILTAAAAISFFIRMRSFDILYGSGNMIGGPDPWYYLRQVELSIANNLGYVSYDPYSLFPGGGGTRVSSLFVRISAVTALLFNCVTQIDLISILSFIPAVMGVCMVPVAYFLGKKCGGRAAGVIAALFIAVISGQFLARTQYGYFDHHALETLISSLFCLSYIAGICALKDSREKIKIRKSIIYGLVAGFTFFLGFQNLYVMSFLVLVVIIYTIIQFIINQKTCSPSKPLLIFNITTFLTAAAGYFICGITGVSEYSVVYLFAHLLAVIVTIALYALSKLISRFEKPWYVFLLSTIGIITIAALSLRVAAEPVFTSLLSRFNYFFSFSETMNTVGEMKLWSVSQALYSYNLLLILAIGGCVWMAIKLLKGRNPAALFVLVWFAATLSATCFHIRFEYYLAPCIALLAAVCVVESIRFAKDMLPKQKPISENQGEGIKFIKTSLLILSVAFALMGFGISAAVSIDMATPSASDLTIDPQWDETCKWIRDNTPDTGIPFIDNYQQDKIYESAHPYGVFSWWDYGWYIMEQGKRMPTTNPGQARAEEGARILLSSDEKDIREQLEAFKVKYVITDSRMCSATFPAITIWCDPEAQTKPYITEMLNADGSTNTIYTPAYYKSLLVRLHRFDGSSVPQEIPAADELSAFTCFRLVHESPSAEVKVFELVDGFQIAGAGTIECEVTTDQGRRFTYRQTSTDGVFVVPYVTGKNGGVTASEYRVIETGETVSVPEDAVQEMMYDYDPTWEEPAEKSAGIFGINLDIESTIVHYS